MSNRFLKIFTILIFSLVISFVTYKFCYFIAEKYFFDKFFYYKNTNYGYWIPHKNLHLSDFGARAQGLIDLDRQTPILGITDDHSYKIAIIGDSLVWGQGIKNSERFAYILEKKLNKIRPTRIISLGACGDNLFDNYMKYKQSLITFGKMDLYIFALYSNDLVLNTDNRYSTNSVLIPELSNNCSTKFIYNTSQSSRKLTIDIPSLQIDSPNYCLFQQLLPILPPQENSIYIDLGSLEDNDEVQAQFSQNVSQKLHAISLPYQKWELTRVSSVEGHPSIYSNKIYADTLYQEITDRHKWNFSK